MDYNENITEALAVLAVLASASQSTSAKTIGPFSVANMRRVVFYIDIGALGASGTVDFKVQAAPTSGGSYTDVAGTTITQITAGASNFLQVEVKTETLMNSGQGPYIKGVLTPGTAASQASVIALGAVSRFKPASDYNLVTPAQTLVA